MKLKYFLIIFFVFLNSCSKEKEISVIKELDQSKEMIVTYKEGFEALEKGDTYFASQKFLEAEKELIEAHKLYANNLIDWKSEQRILHASCIKFKKMLFCDLHGNYEVYKKGELTLITNQAHKAIKEYNKL